ncbi:S8 family serine peptidase [Actinosynnema sp. NPDC047251]|uniref:Putative secreted serine protease n=1 Tax=Saccharothrix espanaensis (strain ATCC 51144 / DSM 44229 / JCM 9112 / NBRC 15066 / NRRL 15764) TaxID=1179773 RepID=K0JZH1_SACES|nr:S8 family serine peptidase [Saccharothrix espanaensis]CCH33400.1 putative secreted serine protease [Saccharothrix espanaensis DSM 44229]
MGTPLRAVAVVVALATLGLTPPASAQAQADFVKAREPFAGSFLVSLKDVPRGQATGQAQNQAQIQAQIQQTSEQLVGRYGGKLKSVFSVAMQGFLVRDLSDGQARRLAADPAVKRVFQDGTAKVADTQANATYGIDRVDQRNLPLDTKYTYNTTASNVTTYVLDTGVRKTHSEFEGRAQYGYDFVDEDAEAQDCNGHGTHVSGTIGGKTWGVAKKTKLVAVRILGCGGSAPDSDGVEGIEWIAKNAVKPAVVNGSFTFDTPGIGDDAITRLTAAGVTFVVAAGNSSADACNTGPARNTSVVSVGATDNADNRASFSNYGSCVDIFAPGNNITSASHSNDTGSTNMSGTSMASPHVAGGAALYLAGNPSSTPAQVLKALTDNATSGVVKNPGSGSPNKLLYTAAFGGDVPNPPCSGGSNADDVAIPDAGSAVSSSVTVTGCDGVGSASTSVKVDINHSYTGDLAIDLVGPSGNAIVLRKAGGVGSASGIHETFTVNTASENKNGTWKLRVTDVYSYDTGNIDSWSITF